MGERQAPGAVEHLDKVRALGRGEIRQARAAVRGGWPHQAHVAAAVQGGGQQPVAPSTISRGSDW